MIYIATPLFSLFQSLVRAIGHPELIDDPRCATDELCYENREEIDAYVANWAKHRTMEEISHTLEKARVPFGVYRKYTEIADDPHVQDCKLIDTVDLEVDGLESVPVSGVPLKLSKTPGEIRTRPPKIGEHTRELLASLNYKEDTINRLKEDGIV